MTNHTEKDTRHLSRSHRDLLRLHEHSARVSLLDHADFMDEELARMTSERDALLAALGELYATVEGDTVSVRVDRDELIRALKMVGS